MPQNRRKNRTSFKPGQSGNPGGRPKTAKFSEAVREFLAEKKNGQTRLQTLLETLEKHDPKILLYYAFGKPVESVEISGKDGQPLIDPALVEAARQVAMGIIK